MAASPGHSFHRSFFCSFSSALSGQLVAQGDPENAGVCPIKWVVKANLPCPIAMERPSRPAERSILWEDIVRQQKNSTNLRIMNTIRKKTVGPPKPKFRSAGQILHWPAWDRVFLSSGAIRSCRIMIFIWRTKTHGKAWLRCPYRVSKYIAA